MVDPHNIVTSPWNANIQISNSNQILGGGRPQSMVDPPSLPLGQSRSRSLSASQTSLARFCLYLYTYVWLHLWLWFYICICICSGISIGIFTNEWRWIENKSRYNSKHKYKMFHRFLINSSGISRLSGKLTDLFSSRGSKARSKFSFHYFFFQGWVKVSQLVYLCVFLFVWVSSRVFFCLRNCLFMCKCAFVCFCMYLCVSRLSSREVQTFSICVFLFVLWCRHVLWNLKIGSYITMGMGENLSWTCLKLKSQLVLHQNGNGRAVKVQGSSGMRPGIHDYGEMSGHCGRFGES